MSIFELFDSFEKSIREANLSSLQDQVREDTNSKKENELHYRCWSGELISKRVLHILKSFILHQIKLLDSRICHLKSMIYYYKDISCLENDKKLLVMLNPEDKTQIDEEFNKKKAKKAARLKRYTSPKMKLWLQNIKEDINKLEDILDKLDELNLYKVQEFIVAMNRPILQKSLLRFVQIRKFNKYYEMYSGSPEKPNLGYAIRYGLGWDTSI
jgi:hypothetical protein